MILLENCPESHVEGWRSTAWGIPFVPYPASGCAGAAKPNTLNSPSCTQAGEDGMNAEIATFRVSAAVGTTRAPHPLAVCG